jgi:hypothetical protein
MIGRLAEILGLQRQGGVSIAASMAAEGPLAPVEENITTW